MLVYVGLRVINLFQSHFKTSSEQLKTELSTRSRNFSLLLRNPILDRFELLLNQTKYIYTKLVSKISDYLPYENLRT